MTRGGFAHNERSVFEIGASLAAARARGLGLADAERLTCIRTRHLAALESDSFDSIPGRAYARGFLRTYEGALGLDADLFCWLLARSGGATGQVLYERTLLRQGAPGSDDVRRSGKPVAGLAGLTPVNVVV